MDDIILVQSLQPLKQLKGYLPDNFFFETDSRLVILSVKDFVLNGKIST